MSKKHKRVTVEPLTFVALADDDTFGVVTTGVYLHGELEDENGYDLVQSNTSLPSADGIYDCVVLMNQKIVQCKLFFWRRDKLQRGLIVKKGDTEYMDDAREHYSKRGLIL